MVFKICGRERNGTLSKRIPKHTLLLHCLPLPGLPPSPPATRKCSSAHGPLRTHPFPSLPSQVPLLSCLPSGYCPHPRSPDFSAISHQTWGRSGSCLLRTQVVMQNAITWVPPPKRCKQPTFLKFRGWLLSRWDIKLWVPAHTKAPCILCSISPSSPVPLCPRSPDIDVVERWGEGGLKGPGGPVRRRAIIHGAGPGDRCRHHAIVSK